MLLALWGGFWTVSDWTIENYTLSANRGSYLVDGGEDAGAVVVTGSDATLRRVLVISAAAGAISLSGSAAGLRATHIISAASGSVLLAGSGAGVFEGYGLLGIAGSYAVTGISASLLNTHRISAAAGSCAITGSDVSFAKGHRLSANSGSVLITGDDEVASYSITGFAANLQYAQSGVYSLAAESSSIVINGTAAGLQIAAGQIPTTGSPVIIRRRHRIPKQHFVLVAESGDFEIMGGNAEMWVTRLDTIAMDNDLILALAA